MTKIKLCGMMRPADVKAARDLGADYAGFVLTEGFRRSVVLGTFCELQSFLIGSKAKAVGVFVNEPLENILTNYAEMLDLIQLHGNEDNAYIRALKQETGLEIIKAFRIGSEADLAQAAESAADHILLDSGTGTGKVFDWSLLRDFRRPYFLAGGLTPENAGEAVRLLHPFAVDTSSGTETNGQKDPEKLRAFVRAVREA